jgi:hypothetical protein
MRACSWGKRNLRQSTWLTGNPIHHEQKIILASILSLSCGMAAADWSLLNRDAYGTTYFDKEVINPKTWRQAVFKVACPKNKP